MYYNLTSALTDVFIEEIRGLWSGHPRYQDLSDSIQGKFSYSTRPQRGMVIKTTGGNNIRLQADNFQGIVVSHVFLARVRNYPGTSIEWVRENNSLILNREFPSLPGVYYISIVDSDVDVDGTPTGSHKFTVTPKYEVTDEAVEMVDSTHGFLRRPFILNSLRITEIPSNYLMEEGVDYVSDYETGEIIMTTPVPERVYFSADYSYPGEVSQPYDIKMDEANHTAIPGVVIAFGRRIVPNDVMSVVVSRIREPAALEYGGRWEISLDIEIWARDVDDQREITDLMLAWVPSVLRSKLCKYGIEIKDTSFGGETEEPYDNTADDYFYGANISVSTETDWSLHVPLTSKIWKILGIGGVVSDINNVKLYSDNQIRIVENLGLVSFEDPFFTNLKSRFESFG